MNRALQVVMPVLLVAVIVGILAPVWWGGNIPATKDTILSNIPLADYHSRALRAEESLFWCHYGGCGFPIHAESQGGFFHPLNLATAAVFPLPWVYLARWVLALVFGSLAMYAFLRGRMISVWGALIGGMGYALGGYWVARLDMLPLLMAAPVLPLGWLAVEWMIDGRWSRGIALGIGAIAWGLLAGHFQLTAIAMLGIVLYGIGRGLAAGGVVSIVIGVIVFFALGVGLAGVQIIPTLELVGRSGRLLGEYQSSDYSLFPLQLLGMIFPRIFGFQRTVTFDSGQEWTPGTYWGSGVFWEACPYVGAVILVLAFLALVKRHPGALWLAVIAVIGILLALGKYMPIWSYFHRLPVFSEFRIPTRYLLLSSAAIAALGGMGADVVAIGLKRRTWWGIGIVGISLLIAAGLVVVSSKIPDAKHTAEWMGLTGERLAQTLKHAPQTLSIWDLHQAVPLMGLFCLGLAVFFGIPRSVIAGLILAELGFFAYQALPPIMDYQKLTREMLSARMLPEGRVYSDPLYQSGGKWDRLKAMPANVNWMSGLLRPDVRGSLFDYRQVKYNQAIKEEFRQGGHRLMSLAGVRTIINQRALSDTRLDLVAGGEVMVYNVPDAVPLAYFPERIRDVSQGEDPLEALANMDLEGGNSVFLEGWKGFMVTGAENELTILNWGRGQIGIDTEGGGGVLRIAESYDPGWRAKLDDRPAKLFRADYLFMAVQVPRGSHSIELSYLPPRFWLGVGLTIVSVVLWLGFWIVFPSRDISPVDESESDIC